MARVRLEAVSKSFDEAGRRREVLRDVSLAVDPGEVVALLGRSGSGKSTLLNLIAGIDRPSGGRVLVDDADVGALGERERTLWRRGAVGFVFQFFHLLPTLTVEENVLLPLELAERGHAARAEARRWLEAVGLGDRGGSFPDRLSGGEQQRVAVARALAHDPKLVLADEPTGALDGTTGRAVLQLLLGLARERRKTVLLVTHGAEIAAAADRVLVLESGRLEARG
jgi:putative ABC transport system ATP-binding protein